MGELGSFSICVSFGGDGDDQDDVRMRLTHLMDNDLVKQRKQVNVCVKRLSHEIVNSLGCEASEFVTEGAAFGPLRFLRIVLSDGRLANVKHYK